MNRWIPLALLAVGLCVAAAFGARNGTTHSEYRALAWRANQLEAAAAVEDDPETPEDERQQAIEALVERGLLEDPTRLEAAAEAAAEARDAVGLPQPRQRLSEWFGAGGVGWGAGVLLIVVGAVLARRQKQAEAVAGGPGESEATFPEVAELLREQVLNLVDRVDGLGIDEDAPEVREAVVSLGTEHIEPIVAGRGALIARHGFGGFAEYFSPFSAGERNLNRCWSALTDGHPPTAADALRQAAEAFEQARVAYERVDAGP